MARQEQQFDDDELSEILRLAIRKQESTTGDLQKRLLEVADELGISHSAIAEAEREYRRTAMRKQEMALYRNESLKSLKVHGGTFAIINLAMAGLNLMTFHEDHEIWFPYILLMWGIGLAIHAMISLRSVDWDDEEFQKWRLKRDELDD